MGHIVHLRKVPIFICKKVKSPLHKYALSHASVVEIDPVVLEKIFKFGQCVFAISLGDMIM